MPTVSIAAVEAATTVSRTIATAAPSMRRSVRLNS